MVIMPHHVLLTRTAYFHHLPQVMPRKHTR